MCVQSRSVATRGDAGSGCGRNSRPGETCPRGQRSGGSPELGAAPDIPGPGARPIAPTGLGTCKRGRPAQAENAKGPSPGMEEGEVRADGRNGSPRASQEAGLFPRAAAPPRPR